MSQSRISGDEQLPSFLWLLLAVYLVTGCKSFQYQLVEPAQYAQSIGRETVRVPYQPLEYGLVRQQDHLIIHISNPTEQPVKLRGNSSYLVDPGGRSHPLREGVIAPHSYIDLYLPPVPLTYEVRTPMSLSFGLGAGYYSPYYRHHPYLGLGFGYPFYPYYDPFFYPPPTQYYQLITPSDWQWKTGEVRMRLVYEQGGKSFDHDFVFLRSEAK